MAKQKRKKFCRPKCRICRFRLDRFSKYSGRTCFWCYLSRWEPIPFNQKTLLQCLIPLVCAINAALWEMGRLLERETILFHFIIFFGFGVLMVLSWRFFDHQIKNFTMRVSGKVSSVFICVSVFFLIQYYG